MDERRQIPRWKINKEAKVWMSETQGFSHCTIEDMHLKGMCLSSNKRLFQQEEIKMSFAIGENFDLIKVDAKIPWSKEDQGKYMYGLSFDSLSDPDKEVIYQYINTHCYDQMKNKWWA